MCCWSFFERPVCTGFFGQKPGFTEIGCPVLQHEMNEFSYVCSAAVRRAAWPASTLVQTVGLEIAIPECRPLRLLYASFRDNLFDCQRQLRWCARKFDLRTHQRNFRLDLPLTTPYDERPPPPTTHWTHEWGLPTSSDFILVEWTIMCAFYYSLKRFIWSLPMLPMVPWRLSLLLIINS